MNKLTEYRQKLTLNKIVSEKLFNSMSIFDKKSQLFILGHMRSRSSLLAHILMNDKTIFGMGESNKIYKNKLDIVKMRVKTRLYAKGMIPFNFTFLDQINHNQKTPNLDLIQSNGKMIVLVRTPKETFESIRKLTKNFYKEWSHKQIEEYYLERLQFLAAIKSNNPRSQAIIIDSEALISNSQQCLAKISAFLELKAPLSSNYDIQTFTGKHGDPSPVISTGKIVKTKSQAYDDEIAKECFSLFEEIIGL